MTGITNPVIVDGQPEANNKETKGHLNVENLEKLLQTKVLAVDCEATGLRTDRGDRPFLFSFTSYEGFDGFVRFTVNNFTREVIYDERLEEVRRLLSRNITFVFHNALFDIRMLESIGIMVCGRVSDTLLLADSADNSRNSFGLKPLSLALFGDSVDDEKELHKSTAKGRREGKKLGYKLAEDLKADFHLADPELCAKYAVMDTRRTMKLYKYYQEILNTPEEELAYGPLKNFKKIVEFEQSLLRPVYDMNGRGIRVFPDKVEELKAYYGGIVDRNRKAIVDMGYPDFNPKSAKQKAEIFYDELGMDEVRRRRKSKDGTSTVTRSVDKKAVAQWRNDSPLAFSLVELAEADKQLDGFLTPIENLMTDEDGHKVIHPTFNICGAHATTRMSCSTPNLQNITTETSPNRISDIDFRLREVFGPRPGYKWLLADYAQIEVINTAYLSRDELMIGTLESGVSIHDVTCEKLFSHRPDYLDNKKKYRKLAKIATFAIFYGTGVKQLALQLSLTIEEAKEIWEKFWETYRGIARYSRMLEKLMKDNGYIEDMFGRVFRTPEQAAYRAFNRMVQGTSAGMFKRGYKATVEALEASPVDAQVVLCIHDELVIEFKDGVDYNYLGNLVKGCMQQDFHLKLKKPTPLDVSLSIADENWNKKRDLVI